jgi:hypothetical protein
VDDRPSELCSFRDLFDEHGHGLVLSRGQVRGRDDKGSGQVNSIGGLTWPRYQKNHA